MTSTGVYLNWNKFLCRKTPSMLLWCCRGLNICALRIMNHKFTSTVLSQRHLRHLGGLWVSFVNVSVSWSRSDTASLEWLRCRMHLKLLIQKIKDFLLLKIFKSLCKIRRFKLISKAFRYYLKGLILRVMEK